jgi:hypothetical protein
MTNSTNEKVQAALRFTGFMPARLESVETSRTAGPLANAH